MASRQDQLHSYQFTVQRVVSALVMRDTDPVRSPFRRIAGATLAGILLAAVSLGAVAVYGVLSPGGGTDWRDGNAVIVERESGARYVYAGGALHPVPNYTSALLVIGSPQAHPVTVSRSTLGGVPRGAPLGIPGAPDPLPAPDRLVGAPWALCSARLSDGPAQSILYLGRVPVGGTELPDLTGLLISAPDGTAYLVWRRTRYRVSRYALGALAWGAETPTPVTPALVNALGAGPDLATPTVPGTRGGPSKVPGARVGQVVVETVPGGGRQYAVALADGLAAVSELQAALLLAGSGAGTLELGPGDFTANLTAAPLIPTGPLAPPETRPELAHPHAADRGLCATVGGARDTLSYDVPVPAAGFPVAPVPAGATATATAAVNADRIVVEPGRGAVVSAVPSPNAPGALSVVSELGIRYPVASADVLAMLGYAGVNPVRLPSSLVSLLPVGPALDPVAARTPAAG
jgi:type VII secretion protein EccB